MERFDGYNDEVVSFAIDVLLHVVVLRLFVVDVLGAALDDDGFVVQQSNGFTRTEESMKPRFLPVAQDEMLFVMDVVLFVENILVLFTALWDKTTR